MLTTTIHFHLADQQLSVFSKMTKFCQGCTFSASPGIFCVILVFLLLVSINYWILRNDSIMLKTNLKDRIEKNQKYRENIKTLEDNQVEMMKELHARDNRTLELVKRKGEIENKVAGYVKENSKLKFDLENIKTEIAKNNSKRNEDQNKLNDLREAFENIITEEENYFSSVQKDNEGSTVAKRLSKLKDLMRHNRNKMEGMLSGLSDE